MNFTGKHKKETEAVRQRLFSDDVIYFDFIINGKSATVAYVDSITDKETLAESVIRPLAKYGGEMTSESICKAIQLAATKTGSDLNGLITDVLGGCPSFIVDGMKGYFSVDLKKFEVRAVAEPPLQTVIKGPREGFNESIKTNLSVCMILL